MSQPSWIVKKAETLLPLFFILSKYSNLEIVSNSVSSFLEFVDDEIEKLQKKVAEKYGYNLVDHKLELYGIKKKS